MCAQAHACGQGGCQYSAGKGFGPVHFNTSKFLFCGSVIRGVTALQKYPFSAQGCPVIARVLLELYISDSWPTKK
jgi:hypothetical protein